MTDLGGEDYDVIIVGAGMVGASAACLLAQVKYASQNRALKIALIESTAGKPFDNEVFDPRVAAVTERSRQILESCGVWHNIEQLRASPYVAMQVWDAESTGRINFDCHAIHQPNLGHIVENSVIVQTLLTQIETLDNVELICPATICDYQNDEQSVSVHLDDGRWLTGALLIAADGANSKVRQHFEVETNEWSYHQEAIVTTIETQNSNQQTAWQCFTQKGPLALLPLNNNGDLHRSSIVWSQESATAKSLMALSDEQFGAELSKSSEYCLGNVVTIDKRFSFPLIQRHAIDYVMPRIALVGDAAHSIHPLAGQGVNLGFSDVEVLVEELVRALRRGNDIGDKLILARYQRRRKPDNLAAMALMEALNKLFIADPLPLRFLRSLGMSRLNKFNAVKNELIKLAMGL
ncbi:MAG: 2-octaprenylphenol hydroxylase [Porticoccaceae bacterium]|jgi:2-octaprenylphenol hydroxylase